MVEDVTGHQGEPRAARETDRRACRLRGIQHESGVPWLPGCKADERAGPGDGAAGGRAARRVPTPGAAAACGRAGLLLCAGPVQGHAAGLHRAAPAQRPHRARTRPTPHPAMPVVCEAKPILGALACSMARHVPLAGSFQGAAQRKKGPRGCMQVAQWGHGHRISG